MENAAVTTLRLDRKTLKEADELAESEHVDRTTVLRRSVAVGLQELKLESALQQYAEEKISAGKAAENAGISLWDLLEVFKKRGINFKTDEDDLLRQLKELK